MRDVKEIDNELRKQVNVVFNNMFVCCFYLMGAGKMLVVEYLNALQFVEVYVENINIHRRKNT